MGVGGQGDPGKIGHFHAQVGRTYARLHKGGIGDHLDDLHELVYHVETSHGRSPHVHLALNVSHNLGRQVEVAQRVGRGRDGQIDRCARRDGRREEERGHGGEAGDGDVVGGGERALVGHIQAEAGAVAEQNGLDVGGETAVDPMLLYLAQIPAEACDSQAEVADGRQNIIVVGGGG